MRYNCSKILDYQHEHDRLCRSIGGEDASNCHKCPLSREEDGFCRELDYVKQEDIDALQKWSDSNPVATRLDKFLALIKGTEFECAFYDAYFCNLEGEVKSILDFENWWKKEISRD